MTPEHQLIQQIRELIQSDMLERTPVLEDFAEQFAELCQATGQRLQRCAEYLAKGMRSEAVHEAQRAPDLLELAKAIQFPELKKWRNVCMDLELATFPALPEDILAKLQAECLRERDLEPLLRQYRRAVYQADRDECIRLLRELRRNDPDNPSWPQNLRPLEESKLPELADQTRAALAADDRYTLKVIYTEFTHPQRVAPPPAQLLEAIKDAILGERREETKRQGLALAARLDKALSAGDAESVAALMEAWAKLEADEAFDATPDMKALVGRVRDWQALRQKHAEEQAEFQQKIEAMWAVLEGGKADEAQVRHHWDNLLAEGREVPERLTRSVEEFISRRQNARNQRRRLIVLAVLVALAALVGTIAFFANAAHQRRRQADILAQLDAMLNGQQFEKLHTYLESLAAQRPAIYRLPEVKPYIEKTQTVKREWDETDRKFAAILDQLDRIRKEGYTTAPEPIQRMLDEAATCARTAEARRALDDWERSWHAWRTRQQQRIDDSLARVSLQLREILESRRQRPFTDLAGEGLALAKIPPILAEGTPLLSQASTAQVETFNELSAQHDGWKRDYERRVQEQAQASERLIALRQAIPAALPDLNRYFNLLDQFAKEFPGEPEAASYAHILQRKEFHLHSILLGDFNLPQFPPDLATAGQIAKWLDGPLAASVWANDLRACLDYVQSTQRVRASLPVLLRETKDLNLKMFRIRKHGDVDWRSVYYPDTIGTKAEEDAEGNKYQIYWGQVFWYKNREETPYLVHTKDIFPNHLSSIDYEIRIQRLDRDNIVPHGKFLYNFVARAMEARQLDLHFLQGIKALLADESIEPVPKAWVLKRLMTFMVNAFPSIPEANTMLEISRRLPTEVPWMNATHLEVIAANQTIAEALRQFPDIDAIAAKLQAQRELTALALSRRLGCVGSIQLDQDRPTPRFIRQAGGEIWILSVAGTGARPTFRLFGTLRDNGTIRPEPGTEGELIPGQILLAPADNRDTRALREPFKAFPGIVAPGAWPTNAWQ